MEAAEGVIGSIKKWLKLSKSSTTPQLEVLTPNGWNYKMYREYLLALTKGRDYLLPIEEYPSRIELSASWHEAFNQIRSSTNEGWILIGYQSGQRRLVIPRVAEKGLSHSVPYEVMAASLEKARARAGITDLVGDVHSHPRPLTDLSWYLPDEETSDGEGAFSLGDLYGFLCALNKQRPSDPKRSLMFVAEGNENIAAFATRRTLELVRNNFTGTYEQFAKQWYGKYGWNFKGSKPASAGGGELAEPARPDAPKIWQINKGVAYHYQLALYRGFKDKPLLRDYPARVSI